MGRMKVSTKRLSGLKDFRDLLKLSPHLTAAGTGMVISAYGSAFGLNSRPGKSLRAVIYSLSTRPVTGPVTPLFDTAQAILSARAHSYLQAGNV